MSGSFIHSLVATDICTGWTEAVPRMVREQSLVVEGLEAIARQLPFQVLGIDSDNDSAFINETLVQYCAKRGIEFTRSRAYRNNDQAWIEQKNGSVVRRFTGHDRYSGRIAGQAMVHPYKAVSAYVNYFQPSFKLLEKMRDGAKTIKHYSPPATPCDRLMQDDTITAQAKEEMSECRAKLDPVALLRSTSEAQSALAARYPHTTLRKQLPVKAWSGFWPACPAYGNRGKPGPRIRRACAHPAHWRTRKEPFEGVWLDVLLWLEKDPDTNARDLLARLRQAHPGRFGDAQLRTLQRRVKDWRGVMARKLVYAAPVEPASEPSEQVELVLAEEVNRVVDVKHSSTPEEEQPCPGDSQTTPSSSSSGCGTCRGPAPRTSHASPA